jgi:glycolate oxidase iron-sulfur subunit
MTQPTNIHAPSEDDYIYCIRCGLCLATCPTYREYLTETASPRGRVALTRKALEGELELSPNLFEQMYACFGCLACNEICPVGNCPADLALAMRHVQEQVQPAAWKRPLFRGLIPHPTRMEWATFPLRLYQTLGLRRLVYSLGLRWLMPAHLRDMEAMLPHLPQRPLRHVLPEVSPADGEGRYRVGFFLGCAQSLMFAEESSATVRVLTRNHCTVVTPKEINCCGMPAFGYGHREAVQEQARHNIALFEETGVEVIITDCATCGSTLKEYGEFLADDPKWAERAASFSQKVRDINEFLMEIPLEKPPPLPPHRKRGGKRGEEVRVTYHDPCHLRRAQGVWQQPRALMQMIEGVEFVELEEADWCCGSAGSQLITHPETSLKVLARKMNHLEATGAQIVASGCPGCRMQLNVGVRRRGLQMEVVHPVMLLDRAYR